MGLSHRHRHVSARCVAVVAWWAALAVAAEPIGARAELKVAVGPESAEQPRALGHGQAEAPVVARREPTDGSSAGGGLSATVGRVFTERAPNGWFGRLELEGFGAGRYEGRGPVGGVTLGGELWIADGSGGGGLPFGFWLGYRTPVLFGSLGVGALMFEIDEVDDDRGFGIYAPFGTAALGVEVGGTRLLADARALYRWQWGAPDRAQLQLGLRMVHFIERVARAPAHWPRQH
jgi:hypothetical protein